MTLLTAGTTLSRGRNTPTAIGIGLESESFSLLNRPLRYHFNISIGCDEVIIRKHGVLQV
jgi:hypothetical protein